MRREKKDMASYSSLSCVNILHLSGWRPVTCQQCDIGRHISIGYRKCGHVTTGGAEPTAPKLSPQNVPLLWVSFFHPTQTDSTSMGTVHLFSLERVFALRSSPLANFYRPYQLETVLTQWRNVWVSFQSAFNTSAYPSLLSTFAYCIAWHDQ